MASSASKRSPGLLGLLDHPLAGVTLLLVATVVALVWANSPWADVYRDIVYFPVGINLGDAALEKPLLLWINDGLMAIFFFLVGLEIKREVLVGDLAHPRKAALAVAGALGGMAVPALLYVAMQTDADPANARGWGIPMATDIAFALGVLALLGSRVPPGLRIFLTALAIVDDIGAVLVIAIFYTDSIALGTLGIGLALFAIAIVANRAGARNPLFYFLLGTLVWLAFLKSGVHATIAALIMAFAIPARTRIDGAALAKAVGDDLEAFREATPEAAMRLNTPEQQHRLEAIARHLDNAQAPLQSLEHQLEPVVKRLVLPVFALANAGVALDGGIGDALSHPVALGIGLGLVVGKPLGIVVLCFLAVKLRLAELPEGVGWLHVLGAGMLAGIGFTMALFVAGLAFDVDMLVDVSKVGILGGSVISAVLGLALLRLAPAAKAT